MRDPKMATEVTKFADDFVPTVYWKLGVRWSRFLRQSVKVDLMTKRMIHHEDTQTVHG